MVMLEARPPRTGIRAVRGTTPARLLLVAAVLVLGCALTAATSIATALDRSGAVDAAAGPVATLSGDAATIYGALADADAAATSGFVSPGVEPPAVRATYDAAIDHAATALVDATARSNADADTDAVARLRTEVTTLARGIPVYAGLLENARALNRLGLPLGQTYLVEASDLMRGTLLPAASSLRGQAGAARVADLDRGHAIPWPVLALGLGTLVALVVLARGEARRTHRRRNPALTAAAVLVVLALAWWAAVTVVTGAALGTAADRARATDALDDARAAALAARSNESLVLVARSGGDDRTFGELLARVRRGTQAADPGDGDPSFRGVGDAARRWGDAHADVRRADDDGRYLEAVRSVVGATPDGSADRFRLLDGGLGALARTTGGRVASATAVAEDAQTLLVAGPALGLVIAAVALGAGMWRRIEEYR